MKNFFVPSYISSHLFSMFFSIVFGCVFFVAAPVWAVTNFEVTPLNVKVKEGETFTLNVKILPHGEKNYTVRFGLEFPPELLNAKSWFYLGSWIPVRKTGYDVLNNEQGLFVRTAGLPGGFSDTMPFGIVTFTAKKSGVATISMKSDSVVLDAEGKNVSTVAGPIAVTIGDEPVQPDPTLEKVKTPDPVTPAIKTSEEKISSASQNGSTSTSTLSSESTTSTPPAPLPVEQEIQPPEEVVTENIVPVVSPAPEITTTSVEKEIPVKKKKVTFDWAMWIMGVVSLILLILIVVLWYGSHKKAMNEKT